MRSMLGISLLLIVTLATHMVHATKITSSLAFPTGVALRGDEDLMAPWEGKIHDSIIFEHAVRVFEELRTASTCNQAAANSLLKGCQIVSRQDRKQDSELLERVMSLYAVRAAICEVEEAGAAVPKQCQSLTVPATSSEGKWSKFLNEPCSALEIVTEKVLRTCVEALFKTTGYWISYSNNRQHAVTMCQVSRYDIDREDALEVHSRAVEASANLTEALSKALNDAAQFNGVLQGQQWEIANLQQQNMDLARENHEANIANMDKFMEDARGRFHDSMDDFSSALKNASGDAERVAEALRSSIVDFVLLEDSMARSYRVIADGVSEIATVALRDQQQTRELALATQKSIRDLNMTELVQMHYELQRSTILTQRELEVLHSTQIENAKKLLELSEENTEKGRAVKTNLDESLQKVAKLTDNIDAATSSVETFTIILEKVGTVFDMISSFIWAIISFVICVGGFGSALLCYLGHPLLAGVGAVVSISLVIATLILLGSFEVLWQEYLAKGLLPWSTALRFEEFVFQNLLLFAASFAAVLAITAFFSCQQLRAICDACIAKWFTPTTQQADLIPNFQHVLLRTFNVPPAADRTERDRFRRAATTPPRMQGSFSRSHV